MVAWQLEVAAGNKLPLLQHQLFLDGHSFEARIYAENPDNDFMPDVGQLKHFRPPPTSSLIRVESGVTQGDSVSVHYDPMICKLVVKGRDRADALRVMRASLDQFQIVGVKTNIEFLKKLVCHLAFIRGDVDTGFIRVCFYQYESTLLTI